MYLRTKEPIYETAAKFWTTLFAVSFRHGCRDRYRDGVPVRHQWAPYSRFVGDVFGSALAAEGIFAFFLDPVSWRFGVRVGEGQPSFPFHGDSLVAIGSMFSAGLDHRRE
jgi:cytochrome d ubiquinol oxidase subunit I